MRGRAEPALRRERELLERREARGLAHARDERGAALERGQLGRDEAEHDGLRPAREEAQRLERARALGVDCARSARDWGTRV